MLEPGRRLLHIASSNSSVKGAWASSGRPSTPRSTARWRSRSQAQPASPPPLDRIIRRCLEKSPDARYADGSELCADLRALQADLVSEPSRLGVEARPPRRRLAMGIAAAILVAVVAGWWYRHAARERWLRNEALPQLEATVDRIQGLEEGRESWDAFILARKIDAVAPGDPLVERLRPKFSREVGITSDPPGAAVHAWYYDEPMRSPCSSGPHPSSR